MTNRTLRLGAAAAIAAFVLTSLIRLPQPAASHRAYHVTVRAGDTIWTIAEREATNETDLPETVDRIISENQLTTVALQPGQQLVLYR